MNLDNANKLNQLLQGTQEGNSISHPGLKLMVILTNS